MSSKPLTTPVTVLILGPAGAIETLIELPDQFDHPDQALGIALITHPHPLFGGTRDNKVVYTLAKTFRELGYISLRPNFRGVGKSAGKHDEGRGEVADMQAVLDYAQQNFTKQGSAPLVLAGFSFGAYVIAQLALTLKPEPTMIVLVGTAVGEAAGARQYDTPAVPATTLLIHGAEDEVIPLANVQTWAAGIDVPVKVVPETGHFFHGKLSLLRKLVREHMSAHNLL